MNTSSLIAALVEARDDVLVSHAALFDTNLDIVPIPYFGKIETARVITVGLNPSDGELKRGRWPAAPTPQEISFRLTSYFENPQVMPHTWFSTWEHSLALIGASYYDGTAAHLDLSPWAARPLKSIDDPNPFLNLVDEFLPYFGQFLESASMVKLVLMAGTVTKKYYMPKFLRRSRHRLGFGFIGDERGSGDGFVTNHSFELAQRIVPGFFCSVSPSSRTNRQLLPDRIREHADHLRKLLVSSTHPQPKGMP
ncbi:MAG: hypothetical protein NTW90_00245 [Nitrosospira sp.]|nr:hypothetical protein [Nitrosospira sp.]